MVLGHWILAIDSALVSVGSKNVVQTASKALQQILSKCFRIQDWDGCNRPTRKQLVFCILVDCSHCQCLSYLKCIPLYMVIQCAWARKTFFSIPRNWHNTKLIYSFTFPLNCICMNEKSWHFILFTPFGLCTTNEKDTAKHENLSGYTRLSTPMAAV